MVLQLDHTILRILGRQTKYNAMEPKALLMLVMEEEYQIQVLKNVEAPLMHSRGSP